MLSLEPFSHWMMTLTSIPPVYQYGEGFSFAFQEVNRAQAVHVDDFNLHGKLQVQLLLFHQTLKLCPCLSCKMAAEKPFID